MSNEYLELYKKHRPRNWSDLIGQESVVKSLKFAVKSNRLPVAYLFSGPRGTGKTSAAKVLASAINCLDEEARKRGDACGKCRVCQNIYNDHQLGVNYFSMANSGGAEDVRKIVERAKMYQPVNRVVWILDEVHNLSKTAWDALLIPLESTSMPSIFILCSTEENKIPETIKSRVQSRSFRLIQEDSLVEYLHKVAEKDELDVSDEEIVSAAHKGRGSVRDSLTALDKIIATHEVEANFSQELIVGFQNRKFVQIESAIIKYVNESGEDVNFLAEDVFADLRDMFMLRSQSGKNLVSSCPLSTEDFNAFKQSISIMEHLRMLIVIGDAIVEMNRGSSDPRLVFESAILKYFYEKSKSKSK